MFFGLYGEGDLCRCPPQSAMSSDCMKITERRDVSATARTSHAAFIGLCSVAPLQCLLDYTESYTLSWADKLSIQAAARDGFDIPSPRPKEMPFAARCKTTSLDLHRSKEGR